jgi:DtxR family Mn-dependent transcriptional regulator
MKRDLKRRSRFADATSVSQEDYLKAIYKMQTEAGGAIGARLSEALNVTPPAVTAALKRMARNGYVRMEPRDGHIRLTAKGRSVAERLVLRHRLIEKLLTEVLGMDWKLVHAEAEKLEHAISERVEKKLLEYFGTEGTCPHGFPLFGGEAALRRQGAVPLEQAEPGDRVRVVRVEEAYGFLEFLDQLHERPGTEIDVLEKSFDETMTLSVGPRKHHLAKSTTSRIWIRKV